MFRKVIFFLSNLILLEISRSEKIIIDTDAGVDDAIAILMYLRYEASYPGSGLEIIGITCTHGNTKEENVEKNVLKTLTVAERGDIPVYAGAKQGFIEPFSTDNFFGSDGFGDAEFDQEIITEVDRSKIASVALVDMAKENAGNVSIIAIGPLTNIALAIALDNNFTKNIKHFYIMGASVAGVGNRSPNVEFNIGGDPDSAFLVFNSTGKSQITLVPWEISLTTDISTEWRLNVLGKYESPYMEFINKVEALSLKTKSKIWAPVDAIITACLIEPSLIKTSTVKNVKIVTEGQGRGTALVDYNNRTGRIQNSQIIQEINHKLFQEMSIRYLSCEEVPC